MYVMLYYVTGYRKKVVEQNLRKAFPDKSEAEIAAITKHFYHHLTDIILETIKSFTLSVDEMSRRCPVRNPELLNRYLANGQSVILSGSHYGNWEFTGITMPPTFQGVTNIVFKPLTNKAIDRYLNERRGRTGATMIGMDDVFAAMRRSREGAAAVWILLADQSPSSRKSAHWVPFLGQDTASLPGVDVLARKFGFPVLYYHVGRLRRGYYEVVLSEICPHPETAAEQSISRAFADHLSAIIRANPGDWLWSHKRWKIVREAGA